MNKTIKKSLICLFILHLSISYSIGADKNINYFADPRMRDILTNFILPSLDYNDLASFGLANKACYNAVKKTKNQQIMWNFKLGYKLNQDFGYNEKIKNEVSAKFYAALTKFIKNKININMTNDQLADFTTRIIFVLATFVMNLDDSHKKSAEYLSGNLAANMAFRLIEQKNDRDNFDDTLLQQIKEYRIYNISHWNKFSKTPDKFYEFIEKAYNDFDKVFKNNDDHNKAQNKLIMLKSLANFNNYLQGLESYKEIENKNNINFYIMPGVKLVQSILKWMRETKKKK